MDTADLMEQIFLKSARGRRPEPLSLAVTRELTREDMLAARDEPPAAPPAQTLTKLRQSHHLLARLLASGVSPTEAGLATGYSPGRISVLKRDPAFQELLAYYGKQVEGVYLDLHAKLAGIGMDAVESLHEDLEEGNLGVKDKIALAELALDYGGVAPRATQGASAPPSAGVTINLKVVTPPNAGVPPAPLQRPLEGQVIEVLPTVPPEPEPSETMPRRAGG